MASLRAAGVAVTELDPGRLQGIVSTTTPQPVAAVVVAPALRATDLDPTMAEMLLVLVDVGDPGNVGTLLRVAEGGRGVGGTLRRRVGRPVQSEIRSGVSRVGVLGGRGRRQGG